MAKTKQQTKKEEVTNGKNPVVKMARTVLLATMGTAALGKEELEAIINRLVEKGELAEKDGRELLSEIVEKRKKEMPTVDLKMEGVEDRVEAILKRLNIPTKKDVDTLSRKITALSKKVDELNKKLSA